MAFQKAMHDGYVTCHILTFMFIGVAGAGKSSFLNFILEKPVLENERTSTPLAAKAVHVCPDKEDGSKWSEVDTKNLYEVISNRVLYERPNSDNQMVPLRERLRSRASTKKQKHDVKLEFHSDCLANASDPEKLKHEPVVDEVLKIAELQHFARLLTEVGHLESLENVYDERWIYLVDTGGQSQYQDLLPAFVQHVSAAALFLKLNESLDNYPMIESYNENHEPRGQFRSQLTNEQIIEKYLQVIQSRKNRKNQCPQLFFVGTHRDKLKQLCMEHVALEENAQIERLVETVMEKVKQNTTEQKKDTKLVPSTCNSEKKANNVYKRVLEKMEEQLSILYLSLKQNCSYFDIRGKTKRIYTVNNHNVVPDSFDKKVAAKFRQAVCNDCKETMWTKKIPVRWFVLLTYLQDEGKILSFNYCKKFATALGEDDLDSCLKYLAELNLIHYFPDILPDHVFTTVQVLLNKASKLVDFSFELHGITESSDEDIWKAPDGITDDMCLRFKNRGIVTLEVLNAPKFNTSQDGPDYVQIKPKQLVKVFKKLLVFGQLSDDEFFMPCVLQELEQNSLEMKREKSLKKSKMFKISPLLICNPNGMVFSGIFTGLVVYLLNNTDWNISENEMMEPILNKNYVTFETTDCQSKITLLCSCYYIEVYVDYIRDRSLCPKFTRVLLDGLNETESIQKCPHDQHKLSFFCCKEESSQEKKSRHHLSLHSWQKSNFDSESGATDFDSRVDAQISELSANQKYWKCSKNFHDHDPRELDDSELVWFQSKLFALPMLLACMYNYYACNWVPLCVMCDLLMSWQACMHVCLLLPSNV